jgi:hypothetical protein
MGMVPEKFVTYSYRPTTQITNPMIDRDVKGYGTLETMIFNGNYTRILLRNFRNDRFQGI